MDHFVGNKTKGGEVGLLLLKLFTWVADLVNLLSKGLVEENLADELTVELFKQHLAVLFFWLESLFFLGFPHFVKLTYDPELFFTLGELGFKSISVLLIILND